MLKTLQNIYKLSNDCDSVSDTVEIVIQIKNDYNECKELMLGIKTFDQVEDDIIGWKKKFKQLFQDLNFNNKNTQNYMTGIDEFDLICIEFNKDDQEHCKRFIIKRKP